MQRDGKPAAELATAVAEGAARRGLLLLKAGIHGDCIRVLLPLVIAGFFAGIGATAGAATTGATIGAIAASGGVTNGSTGAVAQADKDAAEARSRIRFT